MSMKHLSKKEVIAIACEHGFDIGTVKDHWKESTVYGCALHFIENNGVMVDYDYLPEEAKKEAREIIEEEMQYRGLHADDDWPDFYGWYFFTKKGDAYIFTDQ